jgi:hypothetical protein
MQLWICYCCAHSLCLLAKCDRECESTKVESVRRDSKILTEISWNWELWFGLTHETIDRAKARLEYSPNGPTSTQSTGSIIVARSCSTVNTLNHVSNWKCCVAQPHLRLASSSWKIRRILTPTANASRVPLRR